jgi:hypothetical protein
MERPSTGSNAYNLLNRGGFRQVFVTTGLDPVGLRIAGSRCYGGGGREIG